MLFVRLAKYIESEENWWKAAMAFGESFGSVLDRTSQVERQKNWQVGKLGETVFETTDSPVAVSILYIFEVNHISSPHSYIGRLIDRHFP